MPVEEAVRGAMAFSAAASVACEGEKVEDELDFSLHPLQVKLGSYELGAIFGNPVFFFMIVGFHRLVAEGFWRSLSAEKRVEHGSVDATLGKWRWPGLAAIFVPFLWQGLVYAAIHEAKQGGFIGVVAVVVQFVLLV
eukprot:gene27532-57114_t